MANTITILVEHDDINYYKDKFKGSFGYPFIFVGELLDSPFLHL